VVDGGVDESYGDGGIVIVDFPGVVAQANAVLVEPGGEAVLAGGAVSNSPDVLLAKLRADGALDPGFGSDGRVITPLTPD
jgi:hypothetical protein